MNLAHLFNEISGAQNAIVFSEKLPDEPRHRRPNISLAKSILDWEPTMESTRDCIYKVLSEVARMNIPLSLPKIDSQKNMVIDVTYVCNYTCNYCRWGSSDTPGRFHQKLEDILVDRKELESIGVERIVLSGGEPLLHPKINQIVHHFSNLVEDVILITNGWLADLSKIQILIDYGLTGVAFSIDSVESSILQAIKRYDCETN